MYTQRINGLREALSHSRFDAIALNPSPALRHLTGLSFELLERPILALFGSHRQPLLLLPELEADKAEGTDLNFELITYGDTERSRAGALRGLAERLDLRQAVLGLEPLQMRYYEYRLLHEALPDANFRSAEALLASLRLRKEASEIADMRRAAEIAEHALESVLPQIRPGMRERELAAELTVQLLRSGSQVDLPFAPIVASGPNSARPHATPGERPLQEGDLLLLDWGARVNGYVSDITRTFAIGEIDAELETVHRLVVQANRAGREAIRAGATAQSVDRAAREVIEEGGYGAHFIHRTGHGIGLQAHEPPSIQADNEQPLEVGMTFTVEPGVYLPGRGGVRIEDDLVVTKHGAACLTRWPRPLEAIP